ncbi:hypothetical protein D9M70_564090 [compost metagenome]
MRHAGLRAASAGGLSIADLQWLLYVPGPGTDSAEADRLRHQRPAVADTPGLHRCRRRANRGTGALAVAQAQAATRGGDLYLPQTSGHHPAGTLAREQPVIRRVLQQPDVQPRRLLDCIADGRACTGCPACRIRPHTLEPAAQRLNDRACSTGAFRAAGPRRAQRPEPDRPGGRRECTQPATALEQ